MKFDVEAMGKNFSPQVNPGRGKIGKKCKISGEKLFFFHRNFCT